MENRRRFKSKARSLEFLQGDIWGLIYWRMRKAHRGRGHLQSMDLLQPKQESFQEVLELHAQAELGPLEVRVAVACLPQAEVGWSESPSSDGPTLLKDILQRRGQ